MPLSKDVLLDLWRTLGHDLHLSDSLRRVAPLLARHLRFDLLMVRQVDRKRGVVETIAAERQGARPLPRTMKNDLMMETGEAFLTWLRQGRPWCGPARDGLRLFPALLPEEMEGTILAGPLLKDAEPLGLLILAVPPGQGVDASQIPLLMDLQEPFAAALRNDRKIHELTILHEAMEADRRSLLNRLDRHDVSESIIGSETGLRQVMQQIDLVAGSDAPVLILGETGSGKEVVARTIHQRSRRPLGPFLRINCGAIPPELIDSELFGHERGSFTGAVGTRTGWFERADGGTLFLDEMGELPLAAQVRLLRILQDGSFERVGGQTPLHVQVRIITATHRDLRAMVGQGRFREDLWYRIAVFPIQLPSLRERTEDIPALAAHFALRAAKRLGAPPLVPRAEDVDMLVSYPWPGNVRELAAVIERAAILGNGKYLDIRQALGLGLRPTTPLPRLFDPTAAEEAFLSLDQAMVRHIETALERARGQIEGPDGAAALLGINPHTLRARMRKLGIDWVRFRPARRVA